MPTLMIMRAAADAGKLEELAKEDPNPFSRLRDLAPQGVLRHRIFATEREVLVVDEWESPEQFQQWISRPEVQEVIARTGIEAEPAIEFARKLDLGDDIG